MSNKNTKDISSENSAVPLPVQREEYPVFVEKIGKTTYQIRIHFSTTGRETMSDKIKRMLRNEISQM